MNEKQNHNLELIYFLNYVKIYDTSVQDSSFKIQDPQSPTTKAPCFLAELQQHQQSQYLVHKANSSTFLERSTITYIFYFNLLGTLSHQLMYDEVAHAEIL